MKRQAITKLGLGPIIALCLLLHAASLTAAATPDFRLVPERGVCTDTPQRVRVQSANFTPGMSVVVMVRYPFQGGRTAVIQDHWRVGPTGTLNDALYIGGCEPTTPDGTVFTFEVYEELAPPLGPNSPGEVLLATTTFTVDRTAAPLPQLPPATPPSGLPNTGQGGTAQPTPGLSPILAIALIGIGAGVCARRRGRCY